MGVADMRSNGEISHRHGEGDEEAENEVASSQKVVVGYALTSKKKKSFLQPKFLSFARGIFFVAIDLNKPLLEQGPFDVVLHKLSGKEWREVIEEFREKHPEVTILDPPDGIQRLHNRQSMLQDVRDLNLSNCYGKVGVPRQLVVTKNPSTIPYEVTKAGMKLPLVAKPLVVDGTAKSHELFLAYDEFSLSELEPPLVLQEFVNHGGLLFKIYIVGETIKVVRRFSLPNISEHELSKVDGLFRFPRVSCAAASADEADLDPNIAEHPPRSLLEKLAGELRLRLGLHLFNIDMIREHGTKDVFYVIDINYFPGKYHHGFCLSKVQKFLIVVIQGLHNALQTLSIIFMVESLVLDKKHMMLLQLVLHIYLFDLTMVAYAVCTGYGKMPDYEHVFTDFLLSLVQNKFKKKPASPLEE